MSFLRRSSTFGSGASASSRTSFASQLELRSSDGGSILVAVDGKPRGWDALEWAAAEALSRNCLLRIMHVFHLSPLFVGAGMEFPVDEWNASALDTAKRILAEAETRARIVAPDIQISVHAHQGTTTDTILREGKRDGLIVLGRSRTGGRIRSAMSVGRRVTRRAIGPVAIVALANPDARELSAGRVVVGLDGTEDPLEVLGFAFRSAQRRGIGVTLIHAYPALNLLTRWATASGSMTAASSSGSIPYSVQLCQETYPDVDLKERILSSCSSLSLVAQSTGAALLVVGAQRRRSRRVAFGLPRRDALHRVQNPVAIVRSLCSPAPAHEGSQEASH
jgi:nucleotide-binding universal stress UspA family protein